MKFEPTFESLGQFSCPDWFADAKFGIWSHWGAQSVPMYGDWYARHMYVEGSEQYLYHIRHYGHPSKFGYKDLVKQWKAENFDPDALMDLYYKAGARYFVGQAMHHDHFFNFPSKYNRFNSAQMGPMKDITGMWKAAADNMHMPFGFTEHLGATFAWWNVNKGADRSGPYAGVPYDGNDPSHRDFYFDNHEHVVPGAEPGYMHAWYTENTKFHAYWLNVMKELIDLYQPDLLYSDGALPFGHKDSDMPGCHRYQAGLEAVAHLYNTSAGKHGENRAVYTQKCPRREIYAVGVLDIEKSQLPGISPDVWQTDTCIGNWFYDVRQQFKKPGHVIEMLVDIISKNGILLLNILQKPDGTIDDETLFLLKELAAWYDICGGAVYGTRPWRVFGEGGSGVVIDGFREDEVKWTASDYRFVRKGENIYAFMMRAPENGVAVVKSLLPGETVKEVRLLGFGAVEWAQNFGVLTVKLPGKMPTQYVNCLEIVPK
jgi:alpha-L-fucosidase